MAWVESVVCLTGRDAMPINAGGSLAGGGVKLRGQTLWPFVSKIRGCDYGELSWVDKSFWASKYLSKF